MLGVHPGRLCEGEPAWALDTTLHKQSFQAALAATYHCHKVGACTAPHCPFKCQLHGSTL